MIQRIQTVWLLLAALVNAGLFYFDLYSVNNGISSTGVHANNYYPFLIIAVVITALPLVAIFMYKKRGQQKTIIWVNMLCTIAFVALLLMRVTDLNNTGSSAPAGNAGYSIGAVLPVISFIFLILALRGIRKDDKLVKSLDRLR